MNFHIVSIGDLCLDVLVDATVKPEYGQVEKPVDNYSIDLGGSIGIFASQIAKLGGKISLIGKVGDDIQGKIVLQALRDSGVDTSKVEVSSEDKTPLGLNLSCLGDRAMLTYLGTLKLIDESVFDGDIFKDATHVHVGGYFLLNKLLPAWPEQIKAIKKNGKTVSLDTNWDPDRKWKAVTQILPDVDVFLPNESEALAISGKEEVYEAGKFLAKLCSLVVIKCGARGAIVFRKEEMIEYPIPDDLLTGLKIADTTGAGDNFDAGFIFEWLSGSDINDCLFRAVLCGTHSLKALGGIAAQIVMK